MSKIKIPFNKPNLVGNEIKYIREAVLSGKISGDGIFTKKCSGFIENNYSINKVLLTTSCSSALDMSAVLIGIEPGDEVILPSYTFTSTANSFLARGAKLKFVDIREDTLNIDETKIEENITSKTKAIVVVHYAGISCEMDIIMRIAKDYDLKVIEDSAQCIEARYKEKYLGSIGDIGCYSFHETKNVICGEGGAILLNDGQYLERAEIIREKGTNRSKFFRGEIDKYNWVDIGSSYLPSEILSAFLYAQLEMIKEITRDRIESWDHYYKELEDLERKNLIRRPVVPGYSSHNGHLFYILLKDLKTRDSLIKHLKDKGILAVFHYIPLHLSPVGEKLGYRIGDFIKTEKISDRIVRLPLYYNVGLNSLDYIISGIYDFFKRKKTYSIF